MRATRCLDFVVFSVSLRLSLFPTINKTEGGKHRASLGEGTSAEALVPGSDRTGAICSYI